MFLQRWRYPTYSSHPPPEKSGIPDIFDGSSSPYVAKQRQQWLADGEVALQLLVAWDGLAVVIHPENTWARQVTVAQLRKVWHPENPAKKWSDVDPSWPQEDIKLYSDTPDSGTFDFFTEAINGKEKVCRKDFHTNENYEVLVKGVADNKYALGYFGVAYYLENKTKLGLVSIKNEQTGQFVAPSVETVINGTYTPLSRPLFICVKESSLKRHEMQAFVRFYLERIDLAQQAGYISLTQTQQREQQKKLEEVIKRVK